ncbi:hypothetical protein HYDPIDRAFT_39835 [Hydnomerulius pinastri MD-312]|uniref:Uncharacterized protein n=1 Tax=Hydnomerulius pinastri MD-312 TaxID=994086 RepID=A0A0C9WFX4_9AGAM|nr:hypothetical protein HYDPIDRAFT_39835 [Hydnomerulius pinastri MD-312]
MLRRQPVKVTYTHKRRRAQGVHRLQSSPLELLPPEKDDITRSEMTRRMLKRSRRAALTEQTEDKNIEQNLLKERIAKRIKHTEDHAMVAEPTALSLDASIRDVDLSFQTPFPESEYMHESSITKPLVPEQLSPVPIAKRILSRRTSSRNLKENTVQSQTLASPFHSRPGSVASSPKDRGRGRSSRASRISLRAKSRTLSGAFKENVRKENARRRLSRKDSTVSLNDGSEHSSVRPPMHQRYPSSPSASYMPSQIALQDWFAPPKTLSRPFHNYDRVPSPHESVRSTSSFFSSVPQFCSTPVISRPQGGMGPPSPTHEDTSPLSFARNEDYACSDYVDVDMADNVLPDHRQAIHISGNSIFSSSGEFTIGPTPASKVAAPANEVHSTLGPNGRDVSEAQVLHHAADHQNDVEALHAGRNLARAFIGEYMIQLPASSPALVTTSNAPTVAHLVVPRARKVAIGKQALLLPGTSSPWPDFGATASNRSFYTAKDFGTLTPPVSPARSRSSEAPLSPGADLIREMSSLDICGDAGTRSDGEAPRDTPTTPLQIRSHSLDNPASITTTATTKKSSSKRKPARNRAGTIRASDYMQPIPSTSTTTLASTILGPGGSRPGARRTRSGTVVGPNSKLAKGPELPTRVAIHIPIVELPFFGSESESDDELLLKGPWLEDLEYLGLPVPARIRNVSPDELNIGLRHGEEWGPPRRLRRR